jgi:hypothetical protein
MLIKLVHTAVGALAFTAVFALAIGTVALNIAAQAAYVPCVSVAVTHPTVPTQFIGVNVSNPASVGRFVSYPQPTATSGRCLPWR